MIGFSGHRELNDAEAARAGIRNALNRVAALHGPLAAVSSAASGSDTLFLEEIVRRDIPFFLLLPFHRMRFQQDFAAADWQRIEPLLERALHVEELGDTETAEEAYMDTGARVVDQADLVIAVWDGTPARGVGGTAEVVTYARDLGKPLILVDPTTGHLREERLEQLAGQGVLTRWDGDPLRAVESQRDDLDKEANRNRPLAQHYFLCVILLHLAAAAVAVVTFALKVHIMIMVLLTAEIFFLVIAFLVAWRHRQPHDTWVHSRIGAELCRSFLAIWHLRGRTRPLPAIGGPAMQRSYRNLCMMWYLDRTKGQNLSKARDLYLQDRVQDQIEHFRRKLGEAEHCLKLLKLSAHIATVVAIGFAAFALILSINGKEGKLYISMKVLAILLLLVSAAMLSSVVSLDYSRRTVRYAEMVAMLEDAARRLKTTRTWHSLTRIAVETEEELLREIVEWHSLMRFAGEPH